MLRPELCRCNFQQGFEHLVGTVGFTNRFSGLEKIFGPHSRQLNIGRTFDIRLSNYNLTRWRDRFGSRFMWSRYKRVFEINPFADIYVESNFDFEISYNNTVTTFYWKLANRFAVQKCFVCRIEVFKYPIAFLISKNHSVLSRNLSLGEKNLAVLMPPDINGASFKSKIIDGLTIFFHNQPHLLSPLYMVSTIIYVVYFLFVLFYQVKK